MLSLQTRRLKALRYKRLLRVDETERTTKDPKRQKRTNGIAFIFLMIVVE